MSADTETTTDTTAETGAEASIEGAEALGEDEEEADADVVGLDVLGLALVWPVALLPHAERERALTSSAEARTAGRRRRVTVPRFTPVTPASSSDSFCHKNVRNRPPIGGPACYRRGCATSTMRPSGPRM